MKIKGAQDTLLKACEIFLSLKQTIIFLKPLSFFQLFLNGRILIKLLETLAVLIFPETVS